MSKDNCMRRTVGILLFPDFETLDFAGPHEVFSVADELSGFERFNVVSIAAQPGPCPSIHKVQVMPDFQFSNAPESDVLVIPGGEGTHRLIHNEESMEAIRNLCQTSRYCMSVCTGAMVLAKLGYLHRAPFCTHALGYPFVEQLAPDAIPLKNERFTGDGRIFSSAGVSAGIDLALHLVGLLAGEELQYETRRYLEWT